MQRLPILIAVLAIIILVGGVFFTLTRTSSKKGLPNSSSAPSRTEVVVKEDGFSPQTLTIKKGTAVIWTNSSKANVSVNSDPHPVHNLHRFLNLGEFAPGSSVQAIFDTAGIYAYHNHLKPSQTGTIVVQ